MRACLRVAVNIKIQYMNDELDAREFRFWYANLLPIRVRR